MIAASTLAGTYGGGMIAIILFFYLLFMVICIADCVCAIRRWPSIGYRVQKWSRHNPIYAAGLLLAVGTLLTHFLANAITPTHP